MVSFQVKCVVFLFSAFFKFNCKLIITYSFVAGALFAISDGMTYGWTSPMIPYLISEESHIKTTKSEAEWLETVLMAGTVIGLPLTIYLVDRIGRKWSLLLAAIISCFGWLTIALADKMLYIFVARFFFGVTANMAFVAAPMYVGEIAEQKIRGFLSSIIYLMMLVGFVIMYCVGPYLPYFVAPLIAGIVLLTEIILFSSVYESPYYLLYINRPDEARISLQYFRPNREIDTELEDISEAVKRQKTEGGTLKDLFCVKSNRKAILIMTVLDMGQHLCAISVMLMNLHLILEAAGSVYLDSSVAGILFAVIMLISAQIASLQMDKYGRRFLLIASTIPTGVCLLVLAIYFHVKLAGYDVEFISWIPIVSVMVYAMTFKIGLGMVPIVMTAEVFSTKIKAMGMTVADAMYVIGSIISIQLYTWLSNFYGIHVPFYIFAVSAFLIAIFSYCYIPETKGKTLEEIQIILKGKDFTQSDALVGETSVTYNTFSNSSEA